MSYIESMFSLEGRKAVVTGGAGAIASAIVVGLAKFGASVCIWERKCDVPISEPVKRLRETAGTGAVIEGLTVDVGSKDEVERAVRETAALIGKPDILVNGVGGNRGKSAFVDLDEETFMDVLRLNLLAGLVLPTKAFARYWIAEGIKGDVINISSMGSYKAMSGVWAYNAAKAGVYNLTEGLAKELAPSKIRVNGIAPGFFIGQQNRALLIDEKTGKLTARGETVISRTPYGRFGETEELVGAVLFLCARKASEFITGVTIPVDGGFLVDNI
jgi:NAD(P)-dependent dehydrogenase (short-subunit alcohol dehydrogenase family)